MGACCIIKLFAVRSDMLATVPPDDGASLAAA